MKYDSEQLNSLRSLSSLILWYMVILFMYSCKCCLPVYFAISNCCQVPSHVGVLYNELMYSSNDKCPAQI